MLPLGCSTSAAPLNVPRTSPISQEPTGDARLALETGQQKGNDWRALGFYLPSRCIVACGLDVYRLDAFRVAPPSMGRLAPVITRTVGERNIPALSSACDILPPSRIVFSTNCDSTRMSAMSFGIAGVYRARTHDMYAGSVFVVV